jgi:hypothetical protein
VEAVIDLKGAEAYGLTADASAVWAISYQGATLSRVDPATNAVTRTVTLAHAASALATRDAIWVAGYGGGPDDSALYRVDPATGRTVATVAVGEVCCDLSEGGGAVWVVDPRGAVVGRSRPRCRPTCTRRRRRDRAPDRPQWHPGRGRAAGRRTTSGSWPAGRAAGRRRPARTRRCTARRPGRPGHGRRTVARRGRPTAGARGRTSPAR